MGLILTSKRNVCVSRAECSVLVALLETPIFFNPLSFKNYLMKIHKFGNKQNTKGQIYRCKKLNQDICYTFLIIHDLKCPRICGHAVYQYPKYFNFSLPSLWFSIFLNVGPDPTSWVSNLACQQVIVMFCENFDMHASRALCPMSPVRVSLVKGSSYKKKTKTIMTR